MIAGSNTPSIAAQRQKAPAMTTPFEQVLAGFRLGESETLLKLDSLEDFARAELALLAQVRRQLLILTPDLEPERFNADAFADGLSALARRSRYSDVRILLAEPGVALRWGHKLLGLSRRLPSKLRIRQLHEDDMKQPEAWIVADNIGLLRRDSLKVYQGMLSAKSIPHAQRATLRFEEMWNRAREIADFREIRV
ncbi:MAG: hypothetical protein Q8J78_07065 [Moraxellaceae bacterium]|nr:hypothetical protein [Moraxellaceae bacterium]